METGKHQVFQEKHQVLVLSFALHLTYPLYKIVVPKTLARSSSKFLTASSVSYRGPRSGSYGGGDFVYLIDLYDATSINNE